MTRTERKDILQSHAEAYFCLIVIMLFLIYLVAGIILPIIYGDWVLWIETVICCTQAFTMLYMIVKGELGGEDINEKFGKIEDYIINRIANHLLNVDDFMRDLFNSFSE